MIEFVFVIGMILAIIFSNKAIAIILTIGIIWFVYVFIQGFKMITRAITTLTLTRENKHVH